MTEVRLQTYWPDCDPAGIVYFANVFRFIGLAEEELFLLANRRRQDLLDAHSVWMPRVETHMKYVKPIRNGTAIRVRMDPQFLGDKSVRYDFQVLDDETAVLLAQGFLTVVCVDRATFKGAPIPGDIREVIRGAEGGAGIK